MLGSEVECRAGSERSMSVGMVGRSAALLGVDWGGRAIGVVSGGLSID
jgi:hypothetical protein